MRMKYLLFLLVTITYVSPGVASLCGLEQYNSEKPVDYLNAMANSLIHLKNGRDKIIEAGKNKKDTAAEMVKACKFANEDYSCAKTTIEIFKKSSNESISGSSKGFSEAIDSLIDINNKNLHLIVDLMNGKEFPGQGTIAERNADMEIASHDAWTRVNVAVALGTFSVVKGDGQLSISKKEDQQIKDILANYFNKKLLAEKNPLMLEATVNNYLKFLSQKWKFADSSKKTMD